MVRSLVVIRADLPTPDAVIVRRPDGGFVIVADTSLDEHLVEQLSAEAPTLKNGFDLC